MDGKLHSAIVRANGLQMRVKFQATSAGGAIFAEKDLLCECADAGQGKLILSKDRVIPIRFDNYEQDRPYLSFVLK